MANLAWYNRPPDGPQHQSLPVWRAKPNARPITGIILCEDVVGVLLHWVGRSVPHIAPDPHCTECDHLASPPVHCEQHACPGCQADRPMRWEGYASIWEPETGNVAIVAITPGTLADIETYREQHGTLRGAALKMTRVGMKASSPVRITLKRSEHPHGQLPAAPSLPPILANMWGIAKTTGQAQSERMHASASRVDAHAPHNRLNGEARRNEIQQ